MISKFFKEKNKNIKLPSEKNFGAVFSTVFLIISFYPLIYGGQVNSIFLTLFVLVLIITIFIPEKLRLLNIIWFNFGIILNKFMSPLIMGIIFYFVITPIGFVLKLSGKDLLQQRNHLNKKSSWIKIRNENKSMKNQY